MKKNYKKLVKIVLSFLILFSLNNALAYDEEYHYDYSYLGSLGSTEEDLYLGEISATEPFRLHVIYQAYDCEQYNDFAFTIAGINASIPCSGDGNREYIVEFGTYENLEADSMYEMYLLKYRDDRRGLGTLDLYVEYIDPTEPTDPGSGTGTTEPSGGSGTDYLFGKEFDLFENVEDLRTFLKWEGGVLLFFMLSIVMLKLFIYKW